MQYLEHLNVVGLIAANIATSHYGAATSSLTPMNFRKRIEDEGEGAVLREIMQISEPLDAKFFFDRGQRWVWQPFRPRTNPTIDVITDYYDAESDGTGNITGQFRWASGLENVYTDLSLEYKYNSFEDDKNIQYEGIVEITDDNVSSAYNGYRNFKHVQSQWIQDPDDAVIIAQRFMSKHSYAPETPTMHTSLYGLNQELYDLVDVTHRTGSLTNVAFQINTIGIDLDNDTITFNLEDISKEWGVSGWGNYNEDAGSVMVHAVSGTSKCGWGRL
jgi:hypothetical protein